MTRFCGAMSRDTQNVISISQSIATCILLKAQLRKSFLNIVRIYRKFHHVALICTLQKMRRDKLRSHPSQTTDSSGLNMRKMSLDYRNCEAKFLDIILQEYLTFRWIFFCYLLLDCMEMFLVCLEILYVPKRKVYNGFQKLG